MDRNYVSNYLLNGPTLQLQKYRIQNLDMRPASLLGSHGPRRSVIPQVGPLHPARRKLAVIAVAANQLALEVTNDVRLGEGIEEKLIGILSGFFLGLDHRHVDFIGIIETERGRPVDDHDRSPRHLVFVVPRFCLEKLPLRRSLGRADESLRAKHIDILANRFEHGIREVAAQLKPLSKKQVVGRRLANGTRDNPVERVGN